MDPPQNKDQQMRSSQSSTEISSPQSTIGNINLNTAQETTQQSRVLNDAGPSQMGTQAIPSTTSDMNTGFSSPIIQPSTPPNWEKQYGETITSLTETWKLFPVDNTTDEFKVIAGLIAPLTPIVVHKIVNPEVWNRYQAQRNHMLKKKLEKIEDLLALGMDETEAKTHIERTKTFRRNQLLTAQKPEYSLNESLLLHCSYSMQSVVDIIANGEDERLTLWKRPNHFGNGIYFVDDPKESDTYTDDRNIIMIFSVLLGDCKDFGTNGHEALGFKRPPPKKTLESRHLGDQFYDSITARNNEFSQHNQYVIFDRNQCYPLYKVQYKGCRETLSRSAMALALDPKVPEVYATARQTSPSFSWKELPRQQIFMPDQHQNPVWPFFCSSLFKNMGVVLTSPRPTTALNMNLPPTQSPSTNNKRKRNDVSNPMASSSQDHLQRLTLECPDCFEMIEITPSTWKEVKCKHNLCASCHTKTQKTGTTLRGFTYTSFRCPICNLIDGIEVGNFPHGVVMIGETKNTTCAGYPNDQTITINYKLEIDGNTKINTTAYLPDNAKGRKIARLLLMASDRKLIFKTGPNDSILWNISHKTSQNGGLLAQGYPDPDYLVRVLKELRSFGIY